MIREEDVTIIIPHLGGTEQSEYALEQCLESLEETTNCKVILALNGNKCKHLNHKNVDRVTIELSEQGQCKAVNAAVATVNTPYIFVTNDDMIYTSDWFGKLTVGLEDEWVGCISPKLVEPKPGAPTFEVHFCGGAGGDFDKAKWEKYVQERPIPMETKLPGFNLPFLISKDIWDIVGGYNINYDPWGSNSDSDLEYKIKLAGIQPYQHQDCIVYHFSQTSGTFEPQNASYYQRNFGIFKDEWGFDRTDNGIWEANFKMPTVEEGRIFEPWWEDFFKEEPESSMSIERPVRL